MIQLLLLLCSCILLSCSLSEGTVDDSNSLTGIVIVGGQPIAAKVALVSYGDHRTVITEAESDSTGHYLITDIPAGRYTVVSTVDWTYGSNTEDMTIADTEDVTLHINLQEFKTYTYDFGDEDIDVYFYHIPIESYATNHTIFYLDDAVNYFTVDDASTVTTYTLSGLLASPVSVIGSLSSSSQLFLLPTLPSSSENLLVEKLSSHGLLGISSSSEGEDSLTTMSSSTEIIPPVLKSITLFTDKDSHVRQGGISLNFGLTRALSFGKDEYSFCKTLMEFNISELPHNATITTAFLTLTSLNAGILVQPDFFSIHKLLKGWIEGESDGNFINMGYGVTAIDPLGGELGEESNWSQVMIGQDDDDASNKIYSSLSREKVPKVQYCSFTITQLVQEWLDDPTSNYGLLISNQREINESNTLPSLINVFSSKAENEAGRPRLEITYSVPDSLK